MKLSHESFTDRVKKVNSNIEILDVYKDMHTNLKCHCTICGYGDTFDWLINPQHLCKSDVCPICAGKNLNVLVPGYNDLESWCITNNREDILLDWDYDANKNDSATPDTPNKISRSNSKIRVHWKCSVCSQPWLCTPNKRTTPDARTGHPTGCPRCAKAGTSYSEQAILYYINQLYPDAVNRDYSAINKEIDIFVPSIMTGIEFDGYLSHKDKLASDNKKDLLCKKNNIRLFRLRDIRLPHTDYATIITCGDIQDGKSFESGISSLLKVLSPSNKIKVNLKTDYVKIIENYKRYIKENNLKTWCINNHREKLLLEWDYEANGDFLSPENVTSGEATYIQWKCSVCGEKWPARLYSRTHGGHDCPTCGLKKQGNSYRKMRAAKKNFADYCKEIDKLYLLDEWDYDENKNDTSCPDTPEECPYGSPKDVHWKCSKCGNKWTASPANRSRGKYMCEECSGKKLIPGENDLESWCHINQRKDLLLDWDYDENKKEGITLTPNTVKYDKYVEVNWKCHICQHPWKARIADRTIDNKGCKICSYSLRAKKHQKPVINLDTGIIYNSIKEAEIAVHGSVGNSIVKCCKGKQKTAYGDHWKYVIE